MWQWERMTRREVGYTDPTPNSWNCPKHALHVPHWIKHLPSHETLINFSSNFLFWAHRIYHRQAKSLISLCTVSSWKAEKIVPIKVFIQISIRFFYTASKGFIRLFIPGSLHWNQLPKCKIWLQYHMQKLMVNNILSLTRCLVRSHRVLDEAIHFSAAYTELSYQRKSVSLQSLVSLLLCPPCPRSIKDSDNKKIQKKKRKLVDG